MPTPTRLSDFIPVGRISSEIAEQIFDVCSVREGRGNDKFSPDEFSQEIHRRLDYPTLVFSPEEEDAISELRNRIYGFGIYAEHKEDGAKAGSVTDGSENYGDWEVMEIMEKYSDSVGTSLAIKHLLRRPKKRHAGIDTEASLAAAKLARIQDLKKVINYLQRDVAIREGNHTPKIK